MKAMKIKTIRIFVVVLYVLAQSIWPSATHAQATLTGNLIASRQVTINSAPTNKGLAVLSNSRLQTGAEGVGAVDLGRLGRIALGPGTDFSLRFEAANITGTLTAGRVVFAVPAGVSVTIKTPHSSVASKGQQLVEFVVEITDGQTRVTALNGSERFLELAGAIQQVATANVSSLIGLVNVATVASVATAAAPVLPILKLSPWLLVGLGAAGVVAAVLIQRSNATRIDTQDQSSRFNPSPIVP